MFWCFTLFNLLLLLCQILAVLETNILWVNPDCGLKTRKYNEVVPALTNMVASAKLLRTELACLDNLGILPEYILCY
jgi:hypothetical protein